MEEQIEKRIKEMEEYRERLVKEANAEINRLNGGIAELNGVLEMIRQAKVEPEQEAKSAA